MIFNIQPVLANENVLLSPLQESDFDALFKVASDPKIWKQHPNKDRWKKEVFKTFFDGAMQSKGAFKIVEKITGNVIGSTRIYDYNEQENRIFIGYTFYATSYWGKGINAAVKAMMLDYLFQFVSKVHFHIGANNIRSQIAIRRIGAAKIAEQEVTYFGETTQLNFVYEIKKEKWQTQNNRDREQIKANIAAIKERIRKTCMESGRDPSEVKLLLATKTVSAERIKTALLAGNALIAENKVQELKEKYEALKDLPHTNHFIGHLQTNKIKDLLKYDVSCVQSLDRLDLAEKLHQRLQFENKTIEVLIQINTSGEESKFGVYPENAIDLVRAVAQLETLKIKGLMTIGLFSAEMEKVRKCFRLLKDIQQQIIALDIPNVEMKELSMGMSGDMETAIAEGATLVRVGTAIFGQRIYPDSYYWDETGKSN